MRSRTPAANAFERTIFGRRWSGFHAPRHTVVFSPEGLYSLLAGSGFERVAVSQAFNPASWAISIGSALHGPGPGVIKRRGLGWLLLLGLGSLGAALDLSSRRSAVVNFRALKRWVGNQAS